MRNKSVFIIIGLLLFFNALAYAQENFLWIEDGFGTVGSHNNPVNIILANESELGGFQVEIKYDAAVIAIDSVIAADRIPVMDLYCNESIPGHLKILVLDLAGQRISPGVGTILQLNVSVSPDASPQAINLSFDNVVISSCEGGTLAGVSSDGYFIIKGINILRIRNGYHKFLVDLYNEVAIGGVQFTLNYNPVVFSVDTILVTSRSDVMTLNYSELQPGEVTVLLYSLGRDSILVGAGTIVEVLFDTTGAVSKVSPLHLQDVVVTNASGEVIEVGSLDCNYSFWVPPITLISETGSHARLDFYLHQNYPNPFNNETTIQYQIFKSSYVVIKIFNMLGEELRTLVNEQKGVGSHTINWDGKDNSGNSLSSGVYIYSLQADELRKTRRLLLLR